MKSQNSVVILFLVLSMLVAGAFQIFGTAAWKFWNAPTLQPSFADTRIITASAESHRLGFDPEIENPRDPFGRLFNLPAIWKLFFLTKIDQSHTNLFAGLLISSYFIGLLLFFARVKPAYGWLAAFCAFFPPIMLGIERGNVDLFMFFLCAVSLSLIEKSGVYASLVLLLASGLKLFPVFGIGALMKYERKTFLRLSAGIVIVFIFIGGLDISSLRNAFANTEGGFDLSYGLGVLPLYVRAATGSETIEQIAGLVSIFMVLLIGSLCLVRATQPECEISDMAAHSLAAFRLGAGIYAGTFLLGNNWDYRLMFLLFTLPQLLEWWKHHPLAGFTLIAVLISLSYLWIAAILPLAYFIDEFANWFMFGGLFYLMIASAPAWLRSEIHTVVARSKKRYSHA